MNIKNNVEIVKLDNLCRGIAYIDNKIVFVNNALIGEIVNINIIKENKKYYIANVIKYIKKSNNRIVPKCPFYNKCGGCNLQHINYEDEINYKIKNLVDIIKKYSNIDIIPEVVINENEYSYRNKISLKINNYNWGYYNEESHEFIDIINCLIASDSINNVISKKNLFNIKNGSIIIRSNYKNELLISINTDDVFFNCETVINSFNVVGIIFNDKLVYGNSYFVDRINDLLFKVNYNSFFQVNRNILSKVFEILNNEIKGNKVLDLYCGVGVLGLSINKKVKSIVGIELNENSIKAANCNAKLNSINNTKYYVGDVKKVIDKIGNDFDSIILDPPRSGIDKKTIDYIINNSFNQLIYMSCDQNTLSRDLNLLKANYELKKIYLLDMFSLTKHVECVCVLNRRKSLKNKAKSTVQ